MGGNGDAEAAGLRVGVVVLGRPFLVGTFGSGITALEMIVTAALGGGRGAVFEVGELLDPCRERASTA